MPVGTLPDRLIEVLRERLAYDPVTGVISRRAPWGKFPAGSEVGWIGQNGYRFIDIMVDGVRFKTSAQRIAWMMHYGEEPKGIVDHEDDDILNNAIGNLRDLTQARNVLRGKRKRTTLPRGVSYSGHNNKTNPYVVQFKRADGSKHHSYHPDPTAAEQAFRAAFLASYGSYPEEI